MKVADAVATWWIKNAEIRHGHVPSIGDVVVPGSAPTPSAGGSLLSRVLPLLLSGVVGAGGVAALPWLADLFGKDAPAVVSPEPATPSVAAEKSGSLYQYLEDRGDHLP